MKQQTLTGFERYAKGTVKNSGVANAMAAQPGGFPPQRTSAGRKSPAFSFPSTIIDYAGFALANVPREIT
jgi:hypothetical protein